MGTRMGNASFSLFIPCPVENSPAGLPYSQTLHSPLHSLVPPFSLQLPVEGRVPFLS